MPGTKWVGALATWGAIAVLSRGAVAGLVTWEDYTFYEYQGHYYTVTQGKMDWRQAEAEAVGLGGHLVAINDEQEQNWIIDAFLMDPNPVTPAIYWIGLTDEASAGDYVWTTGEPLTYTNWNDGRPLGATLEPNNPSDHWTAINWHYVADWPGNHTDIKGTWNDTPLEGTSHPASVLSTDGPYAGIIELDSDPAIPEPSTLIIWSLLAGLGMGFGWWRRRKAA